MVWQEVFVNRKLKKNEILSALGNAFNISINSILVARSIDDIEVENNIKVLCQTYIVDAEYSMKLSIYLRDDKLIPKNDLQIIAKLCEILDVEVLVSDYSANPFTMLHVNRLEVDIDKYDEAEEYETE